VGEYVTRTNKAWTQGNANPYSVAVELCAFAEWDPAEWHRHPVMLENCAAWIAEEAAAFGIPLVRLTAAQAQGGGKGVCQHVDLGASGGGHWDCGPGFPIDEVLAMAAGGRPEPEPEPEEDEEMLILFACAGGTYLSDGVQYRWVIDGWDLNAIRTAWPNIRDLGPVNGFKGFGVPADPATAGLSGQPWPAEGPAA
jgi:hypothetical protein